MIESYLIGGRQNIGSGEMTPGQSITDACIGWDETAELLKSVADSYDKMSRKNN
jgi:3-deoxy-7-phosphoheptulonate synthase